LKDIDVKKLKEEMLKSSFLDEGCAFDESSLVKQPNLFFNPIAAAKYALEIGKEYEDLTLRELEQFRIQR